MTRLRGEASTCCVCCHDHDQAVFLWLPAPCCFHLGQFELLPVFGKPIQRRRAANKALGASTERVFANVCDFLVHTNRKCDEVHGKEPGNRRASACCVSIEAGHSQLEVARERESLVTCCEFGASCGRVTEPGRWQKAIACG